MNYTDPVSGFSISQCGYNNHCWISDASGNARMHLSSTEELKDEAEAQRIIDWYLNVISAIK